MTDLRQLSSAWVQPPKFKTDNWPTVGDCLSTNPHLTWGAVVDLSNFFFRLCLHPSAGRWIRIKTEMGDFQWTALPFGLHCSPYWMDPLAQVVEKTLRHKGVHLFWHVDDILILGDSQQSVSANLEVTKEGHSTLEQIRGSSGRRGINSLGRKNLNQSFLGDMGVPPCGGEIVGYNQMLFGVSNIVWSVKLNGIVRLEPPKGAQISTGPLQKGWKRFEKEITFCSVEKPVTCNGINCA